jgi:hypothetical protein
MICNIKERGKVKSIEGHIFVIIIIITVIFTIIFIIIIINVVI